MRSTGTQIVFCVMSVGLLAAVPFVNTCSFAFKDVCQNVTCPNGSSCEMDISYYCENRFGGVCSPVATCNHDIDPCKNFSCPVGSTCVNVTDTCDNNTLCTMKGQCNVRSRPGNCPDPKNLPVHSCQNVCSDSDHMCPKDMKCCYSGMGMGNFCVATWNLSSKATASMTSAEEDVDDPRTLAARILHPWNKIPKNGIIAPIVPV